MELKYNTNEHIYEIKIASEIKQTNLWLPRGIWRREDLGFGISRCKLLYIGWLNKVKEESEKVGLKLNIQKTKIMESGPITSWQIDEETMETVADYFSGLQNHCRW